MAMRELEVVAPHRDQQLRRFVCLVHLLYSLELDLCIAQREEILDQMIQDNTGADE